MSANGKLTAFAFDTLTDEQLREHSEFLHHINLLDDPAEKAKAILRRFGHGHDEVDDKEKVIPAAFGGLSKTQREIKAAKEELEAAKKEMMDASLKIKEQEEKLITYEKDQIAIQEKLHEADVEAASLRRQLAAQNEGYDKNLITWQKAYESIRTTLNQERQQHAAAMRDVQWQLQQRGAEIQSLRTAIRSCGITMERVSKIV